MKRCPNTIPIPSSCVQAIDLLNSLQARDYLQGQPGYVSTALHQSLQPDAKYRLINVAQWESAEAFMAANEKMRAEADLPAIEGVVPGPALYEVIRRD